MKRLSSKTACTSVVALAAALSLAGCSGGDGDSDTDGGSVVGVAAAPADSPAQDAGDAAGTVSSGDEVTGLVRVDGAGGKDAGSVAALSAGTLRIGDLAAVADGSARSVTVDPSCGSLTSAAGKIVLACGDTVKILGADGKEQRSLDIGSTVTAAATVADGTVVVTTEGTDKARWFDADGKEVHSEGVSASPSGMVVVGNTRNGDDAQTQLRVATLDAEQSTIADLDMDKKQFNAALRTGQGLGTASAGSRPDGVVVVSDPRSDQALVYTVTDVIRHTEATVTGPSPWAVLWDSSRQLMWVSTTGDNRLTAYTLASGTPVEVGHVGTVADVRHIVDDGDGGLLLVAADGTRELIPSADLPTGR